MARKPTYEELEQRGKELENELAKRKRVEKALWKSESKYGTLLEHLPQKIFHKDRNSVYVSCNQNYARDLKIKPEEIKGKTDYEFFPKELAKKYRVDDKRIIASGKTEDIEEKYVQDGQEIWVHTAKTPIKDEKGNVIGILGIFWDITEQKRGEDALRKSEEKLDAMLRSIGDHMCMMDKDLNIIWANEIAKKVFGNDIIGKKCFEAYHRRKEPCEPYPCITLQAFQDGKVHEHDTQVIDKDGKIIHFHCTANVALRDKEGKPAAVIELSRDITDHKHADEALQEREAALEARTTELEELNSALRVLLKQRDKDKTELEEKVILNVKELILPYIEKLKGSRLDAKSMAYLSVLESNLNDIVSPFVHKLSSNHSSLTPAEIQIAYLVRDGRTAKEMAELLNVSRRTIESHRQNIRMKVGLHGKKANLRSHLLSI
jgi:PAS domain S-box-containing protein